MISLKPIFAGKYHSRASIVGIVDGKITSLSGNRMEQLVSSVAFRLISLGVTKGACVGIYASNSLEWVVTDLAVLRVGAITVGFDRETHSIDEDELMRCGVDVLITDDLTLKGNGVHSISNLCDMNSEGEHYTAEPSYSSANMLALKFTSGSTGKPKGVGASVASVEHSIDCVQRMFNHCQEDTILVFLPLSLLQQRYWIYSALMFGHSTIVGSYLHAIPLAQKLSPTVIMGVPGFYNSIKKAISINDSLSLSQYLGGKIRYCWTGSAPIANETIDFFFENKVPLYNGYGMNETCIVSKNNPQDFKRGSVGKVIDGKSVEIDSDGNIVVVSEYPVASSYMVGTDSQSKQVFIDKNRVATGDIGYIDQEGFLYIQGRNKDLIARSNGTNLDPLPIEKQFLNQAYIDHAFILVDTADNVVLIVKPKSVSDVEIISSNYQSFAAEFNLRIDKLILTFDRFTPDNGMLTSQYKPKRNVIATKYKDHIEKVFTGVEII